MRTKRIPRTRSLAWGASTAALLTGLGLMATPATAQPAAQPPAAPASNTLGEVIVTATRREEALSKVPVAVTAISGEQVKAARLGNFSDLPSMVPGATFVSTKGQSTANVQIRGQSTTNDAPALELPVAIFMDDIYYGTLASFSADFFDLQQIAILRGPQGTTFGRNVVGGALQITSNKPKLGDTHGEVSVTAETYGRHGSSGFESQGFFNLPINDQAAARIAYSVKDVDGYMHNVVTGNNLSDQKSYAIRPSLLWQPTDDFRLTAFVQYNHENMFASGYRFFGQGAVVANAQAISSSPWDVFQDVDGVNRRNIVAGQVRADWDQPLGTLTSITSYRTLDSFYRDDGDNGPLPMNSNSINESKEFQFSQEFRLTSPSGRRFEYVAGLYYGFENLKKSITFGFNGTVPGQFLGVLTGGRLQNETVTGDAHVMTIAPFAEGKFHVTDQLALTLGARYTLEEKNGYTRHANGSVFYGAPFDVHFRETWRRLTPRAILEFKPTDDALLYAGVSTGFKGGGWSLTSTNPAAAVTPLDPEKSTSYEAGAKVKLFDRRLSINAAVYQADTKNLQVRSLVGPVLTDTNAGTQRVKGVELETVAALFDGLRIGANYAYTDAKYRSFPGCAAGNADCSGNRVPFVPMNDLKLFADYAWSAWGGDLSAHVDAQWASTTEVVPTNYRLGGQPLARPFTKKDGILNASLTYEPVGGSWRLQLWGKNLTNRWYMSAPANYYFYYLTTAEFAAGLREVDRGVINPPRQVGATFTYKFQ
ncbi:TonB-dependent receptor [Phenylobacterium sp. LjRoot225]|uniref:TonB-dependent receptor n=1 Tax=Phenylobacterium sp. LjRoot225 TaxID=3342285 RepID=UPI003ECDC5A7